MTTVESRFKICMDKIALISIIITFSNCLFKYNIIINCCSGGFMVQLGVLQYIPPPFLPA